MSHSVERYTIGRFSYVAVTRIRDGARVVYSDMGWSDADILSYHAVANPYYA